MSALPGTEARRRIYLMRHGHVDYLAKHVVSEGAINIVPLTMRGRLQAEAAGAALATPPQLEIDEHLVEIVGGQMSPPPKSRSELIERMKLRFSEAGNPGATNLEGGEEYAKAQTRAVTALKRLLKEPGWHTALVVAHEGINRLVLSWAC